MYFSNIIIVSETKHVLVFMIKPLLSVNKMKQRRFTEYSKARRVSETPDALL